MGYDVNKVIAVALAEEGYLEKSKTAYMNNKAVLDHKTNGAGSDNYTKYGRDMHEIYPAVMDFPAAWCDCFVDWCFYKAYGVTNAKALLGGNFDDYTVASANLYKKKNAYHNTPKVGDQIFFNKGTKGAICHTGLVVRVTDTMVYTIEGNTSSQSGVIANGGCVRQKSYKRTYAKIDGYGRPKYDEAIEVKPVVDKTTPKFLVNKTYTTQVTLNVRKGAGTQYGKKKLNELTADGRKHAKADSSGYANLQIGTSVTCLEISKDGENIWIRIPSGWIAAYYNKKVYVK